MLRMCNTRQTDDSPVYAVHRDGMRWSILAPCADPHGPAWHVVEAFDEPVPDELEAWAAAELRRIAEQARWL
jgi:hypothetical protein